VQSIEGEAEGTHDLSPDELTSTMKDLLTAAFEFKAFARASCRSGKEIAKKAGVGAVHSRNVRDALKRCRKAGLIDAWRGMNGGICITSKGCEYIGKSLRPTS
jgi:hypothetical protein